MELPLAVEPLVGINLKVERSGSQGTPVVKKIKYVHWQEGEWWLGYLEDYPDYWTQGESLADLEEHLRDLYIDLAGDEIPSARKVGEFVLP